MAKKGGNGKAKPGTVNDSGPPRNAAEELLGQMMFALGAGAGGVHIKRSAIAKMRGRYEGPTAKFVTQANWNKTWEASAIYTLRYFEVIGRLAAQHATKDGTTSINADHFERARVLVEATYRKQLAAGQPADDAPGAALRGMQPKGDICPPPPGP